MLIFSKDFEIKLLYNQKIIFLTLAIFPLVWKIDYNLQTLTILSNCPFPITGIFYHSVHKSQLYTREIAGQT